MIRPYKVFNDIRMVTAVAELRRVYKIGTPRERWKWQHQSDRMLAKLRTGDASTNPHNPSTPNQDNS